MANYYNKVSTVFWKSGNALFHACTLHRLYHLSREMRKNLTQEEMQRYSINSLWINAPVFVFFVFFNLIMTNYVLKFTFNFQDVYPSPPGYAVYSHHP